MLKRKFKQEVQTVEVADGYTIDLTEDQAHALMAVIGQCAGGSPLSPLYRELAGELAASKYFVKIGDWDAIKFVETFPKD